MIKYTPEEWKDINDRCQISNFGNVKGFTQRGIPLKISKLGHGYLKCGFGYIHQLVWDHFGDRPRNGRILQIDHIDEDKTNNRIDNLQLLTASENTKKSVPFWPKYPKYQKPKPHKLFNNKVGKVKGSFYTKYTGVFKTDYKDKNILNVYFSTYNSKKFVSENIDEVLFDYLVEKMNYRLKIYNYLVVQKKEYV